MLTSNLNFNFVGLKDINMRPVIGVIGNYFLVNDQYPVHTGGIMNGEALVNAAKCMPLIIPADPHQVSIKELQSYFDGFVFTGGRANVHPKEYGEPETDAHGFFDRGRDKISIPLIRACVTSGQPFLGICRGFQEVAVAMGSSLHPEIRDIPGRDNHRMPPDGTLEQKFALRHKVKIKKGGPFHRIFGSTQVMTNTLHGQGIRVPGPRVVVDGVALDGTVEAIYIKDAPGFTLSVQWHPEYNAASDPVSRPLFEAFGAAAKAWQLRKTGQALKFA